MSTIESGTKKSRGRTRRWEGDTIVPSASDRRLGSVGHYSVALKALNDLWEFNPTAGTWTWVTGDISGNIYGQQFAPGVYVPSTSNVPIARYGAVSWKDRTGNLWLFGGSGYVSKIDLGSFNDLWEFNLTTSSGPG